MGQQMGTETRGYSFFVSGFGSIAFLYLRKIAAPPPTFAPKLVLRPMLTPFFMGAESCEKSESLQTFFATFLMYALYGSKKLRKKFGNFHCRQ